MEEVWKQIPYWTHYEISDQGNIRRNGRLLKPFPTKWGYLQIDLSNKIKKRFSVHRLVLLTFVGESDLPCNHKDGIKTNNKLTNLEYVTYSQNERHSYDVLGKVRQFLGKLSKDDILSIRSKIESGHKQRDIAIEYGISFQHVNGIYKRRGYDYV